MKVGFLIFALSFVAHSVGAPSTLHLSCPALQSGERIVAFTFTTHCLRVTGVENNPADSTLAIRPSDDGGGSVVTASCSHGAPALTNLDELVAFGYTFEKGCKDQSLDGTISATTDFEVATIRTLSGTVVFDGEL